MNNEPSARRLRGKLAEAGLHIYEIAAAARMHPRTIGEMLNERRPLTAEAAGRIQRAIHEATETRSARAVTPPQRLAEAIAAETRSA